jgi:undecaprenyl-diphosphatase
MILCTGFTLITLLAWAGSFATPDALDRQLLLALNPDTPVPVLDAVMIASTDYAIPYVVVLLLCCELATEARLRDWIAPERLLPGFGLVGIVLAVLVWMRFGLIFVHRSVPIAMTPVIVVSFLWVGSRLRRFDEAALLRVRQAFVLTLVSIALAEMTLRFVPALGHARARPFNVANAAWNGALRIIPDEHVRGAHSYPSGHAVAICALLTPLFWVARERAVRAALFALAALVVYSRVYVAAHFPFDAIAGAAIGVASGTLVTLTLGRQSLNSAPRSFRKRPGAAASCRSSCSRR